MASRRRLCKGLPPGGAGRFAVRTEALQLAVTRLRTPILATIPDREVGDDVPEVMDGVACDCPKHMWRAITATILAQHQMGGYISVVLTMATPTIESAQP